MMHHVSSAADKGREVERTFTVASRIYLGAAVFSGLAVAVFIGSFWLGWLTLPGSICIIASLIAERVAGRWEKRAYVGLIELQADLRRLHERAR